MLLEIQASSAKISPEEVLSSLPANVRERVRGKSAAVFCIGEEGVSRPREVGRASNMILRWPRAVIRRLAEAANNGVKIFERHGKDNGHAGREPLGEIVGTFTRMIGDKLQALAVVVPEPRADLDVCSIEADVETQGDVVGDVANVSALAVSSSSVDSPAFAGAQRLATLQCFEPSEVSDGKIKPGKPGEGEPTMAITFQEVRDFIRDHNVFPRQLFTLDDVKNDREFGPLLAELDTAKKQVATLQAEIETVKKNNAEAIRTAEVASARERFEKLIPKGATEKQKQFYVKRFDPSKLEKLDDAALTAYLENETKEFAEHAKLFGVTDTEQKSKPSEKNDGGSGDTDAVDVALKDTIGA